ncbi:MAG: hypothetical protein QOJ29_916, partial [Thermoleophilaceae bacterium]|nr:hypothetical protein [Thermoleophilaceae bacterium]
MGTTTSGNLDAHCASRVTCYIEAMRVALPVATILLLCVGLFGCGGSNKSSNGSKAGASNAPKLNDVMKTLTAADRARVSKESDLQPYRDAMAAAKKECGEISRLRLAKLAVFAKQAAKTRGVRTTALSALEKAPGSGSGSCEKRFQ